MPRKTTEKTHEGEIEKFNEMLKALPPRDQPPLEQAVFEGTDERMLQQKNNQAREEFTQKFKVLMKENRRLKDGVTLKETDVEALAVSTNRYLDGVVQAEYVSFNEQSLNEILGIIRTALVFWEKKGEENSVSKQETSMPLRGLMAHAIMLAFKLNEDRVRISVDFRALYNKGCTNRISHASELTWDAWEVRLLETQGIINHVSFQKDAFPDEEKNVPLPRNLMLEAHIHSNVASDATNNPVAMLLSFSKAAQGFQPHHRFMNVSGNFNHLKREAPSALVVFKPPLAESASHAKRLKKE